MSCTFLLKYVGDDMIDIIKVNELVYSHGLSQSGDVYFCSQRHNKSIPIYTNTKVICGHISEVIQSF